MEINERYEINSNGELIIDEPETLSESQRKEIIKKMFNQNGWKYELLEKITGSHYLIRVTNDNLKIKKELHLFHGSIRKEDPNRNREEKKIQLGGNDPRKYTGKSIILGFYVHKCNKEFNETIIVAWPVEMEKNYPANPSLRVNMRKDILISKNIGFYSNNSTGKNIVSFRPEYIYYYLEEYLRNEREVKGLSKNKINYITKLETKYDHNRILFGAPGTGKSYKMNEAQKDLLKDGGGFERVTFHSDYSYAHFVGTYKPVSNESGEISYEYVPGPFMRTYVAAMKSANSDNPKPYLLIIEEINRANVAGVFGDVFQLLDRNDENISEYPIQTSEDMRKYLSKELGGDSTIYTEIKIPDNMFIWATMNSADQGVYPMDTAFKRRWNFTYLGINDNEEGILEKEVSLGSGEYERKVKWNELRKAINIELLEECKVNEDKLLGPYFIAKNCLDVNEKFVEVFKNKIIMYLFDDAAKHKRSVIFSGCDINNIYSEICKEFDEKGIFIFSEGVQEKFPNKLIVIDEVENMKYQENNGNLGYEKVAETNFKDED